VLALLERCLEADEQVERARVAGFWCWKACSMRWRRKCRTGFATDHEPPTGYKPVLQGGAADEPELFAISTHQRPPPYNSIETLPEDPYPCRIASLTQGHHL